MTTRLSERLRTNQEYGPQPDGYSYSSLIEEAEALEAKLDSARRLTEMWKKREYDDWGGEEVKACRLELEAALGADET